LQQVFAAEEPHTDDTIQGVLAAAAWKGRESVIEFVLDNYALSAIKEETARAAMYSGLILLISRFLLYNPSTINILLF
ncbi:hypothetical protein BKA56DRAFT_504874, partial [Ilyonectria sp. MPI-CAGE-AT-0026]